VAFAREAEPFCFAKTSWLTLGCYEQERLNKNMMFLYVVPTKQFKHVPRIGESVRLFGKTGKEKTYRVANIIHDYDDRTLDPSDLKLGKLPTLTKGSSEGKTVPAEFRSITIELKLAK